MRVLVTVGQQLPFDRLVQTVDQYASLQTGWQWLAQIGQGGKTPKHMRAVASLDSNLFDAEFSAADLVISHAGIGSITKALDTAKPIILMARDAILNEHRNQHQKATLERFVGLPNVFACHDFASLSSAVDMAVAGDGTESANAGRLEPDDALLAVVTSLIERHMRSEAIT